MNLEKVCKETRYLLQSFPEASRCQEYLNSRIDLKTQEVFEFGYFPNSEKLNILIELIGYENLEELGLCYQKHISDNIGNREINFSFFDNHPVVMPFKNVYGEVIAMIGRSILSDAERADEKIIKYKNTIFPKSKNLFGLYENKNSIIECNRVYVVEGQFDVIKAYERGMRNIVALGSANMSDDQFLLLNRYSNNIFLLLDNDEAGEKGRKRIITKYSNFANIVNSYLPPQYKDIDEFLSSNEVSDLVFLLKP